MVDRISPDKPIGIYNTERVKGSAKGKTQAAGTANAGGVANVNPIPVVKYTNQALIQEARKEIARFYTDMLGRQLNSAEERAVGKLATLIAREGIEQI